MRKITALIAYFIILAAFSCVTSAAEGPGGVEFIAGTDIHNVKILASARTPGLFLCRAAYTGNGRLLDMNRQPITLEAGENSFVFADNVSGGAQTVKFFVWDAKMSPYADSFEETYEEYGVTYDSNGGNGGKTERLVSGSYLVPPTVTRDYYTFDGWYRDADGAVAWSLESDTVTADVTVYAKWVRNEASGWVEASERPADAEVVERVYTYTLTDEKTSDSAIMSGYALYGSTLTWSPWSAWSEIKEKQIPGRVFREDVAGGRRFYSYQDDLVTYLFRKEWGDKSAYLPGGTVIGNVSEWVKYRSRSEQAAIAGKVIVTFNSNGGDGNKVAVVDSGSLLASPSVTRSFYTFEGWYTDAACSSAWKLDSDRVTADVTLYAKWAPHIKDGLYNLHLKNADSLVISSGVTPEAPVVIWHREATGPNAGWFLQRQPDDTYIISNMYNGQTLTALDSYAAFGSNLYTQPFRHGGDNQRWYIVDAGEGHYYFVPKSAPNTAMDVLGANTSDGTLLQCWVFSFSPENEAQMFKIELAPQ